MPFQGGVATREGEERAGMSTSTDVGGGLLRLLLCGTMRAFVSHDDDLGGGRWADARTEDWDGARGRPTAPQTPDRSGTWDGNPVERLGTGGSHGSHITS